MPWDKLDIAQLQQMEFTQNLLALKREHPALWQDTYIHEQADPGAPSILWYNTSGELMQPLHWGQHHSRAVGYMVEQSSDDGFRKHYLTLFNASRDSLDFRLPPLPGIGSWQVLLNSCEVTGKPTAGAAEVALQCTLQPCSTLVLYASNHTESALSQENLI
jgi:pullulanase/glycogen debranching enzyme